MVWYGMVPLLPPGPQSLRPGGGSWIGRRLSMLRLSRCNTLFTTYCLFLRNFATEADEDDRSDAAAAERPDNPGALSTTTDDPSGVTEGLRIAIPIDTLASLCPLPRSPRVRLHPCDTLTLRAKCLAKAPNSYCTRNEAMPYPLSLRRHYGSPLSTSTSPGTHGFVPSSSGGSSCPQTSTPSWAGSLRFEDQRERGGAAGSMTRTCSSRTLCENVLFDRANN
jgi:hypothetical protein